MNLMFYRDQMERAASFIGGKLSGQPEWCVVLGSGLGGFSERLTQPVVEISYSEIPGFPKVGVQGHSGKLVFGYIGNHLGAVMEGRFHYYEGHSPETVVLPARVLIRIGITTFFLTNAAGGIRNDLIPGDLMILKDHLNLTGMNPLRGPNLDEFGPRFPALSDAYDRQMIELCERSGHCSGIELKKGVYCALAGPNYETPAEISMLRNLGADAVGMSTVPEVIAIRHAGARVLAISLITNATNAAVPPSHSEVVEMASRRRKDLHSLLLECIRSLFE